MSTNVSERCIVTVIYGKAGERIDAAGLEANFNYSRDVAEITNPSPDELVELSLVAAGREILGSSVVVLEVADLMLPLGIRPAGLFHLLALAEHRPDLIGEEPVIAVCDRLDFTREPNFPREFYPYLERKDGVVVLDMVSDSEHRVYQENWVFLGRSGTGQPVLPEI